MNTESSQSRHAPPGVSRPGPSRTWYRYPIVWMVVILPLVAVVASFTTLWLAIQSDDGVVEDDYYARGKAINRVLERDRAAATRGLTARLRFDTVAARMRLELEGRHEGGAIELRLMHATRAGHDVNFQLVPVMPVLNGVYEAALPRFTPGHWHVQVSTGAWRLTGDFHIPEREAGGGGIVLRPAIPSGTKDAG